jgi:ABC-type branched-subunit amino acid transport system permease subunit
VTGRCVLVAALATVIAASPYFGIPAWTPALATRVAFEAISLIGLNLIFGVTGMLALGQALSSRSPAMSPGSSRSSAWQASCLCPWASWVRY